MTVTLPAIEEGLRAARRLQRARERRLGPLKGAPLALPELDDLHLPMLLPHLPAPSDPGPAARQHPAPFGVDYYRPDGTVIDLPYPDNLAVVEELLTDPARVVARSVRYRRGVRLLISTVFMPMDMNLFGAGPPLLWETMIFHAGTARNPGAACECWRYAARDAALHGHRQIVHRLDTTRRARTRRRPSR